MIRRIFVEKNNSVSNYAESLRRELNTQLSESISSLRYFLRYDIEGLDEEDFNNALRTVFSEAPVDHVYLEKLPELSGYSVFATEYLPGQYDLRSDSAAQCIQLLTMGDRPIVRCAVVYAVLHANNILKIQNYLINPLDSRLASPEKPISLIQEALPPASVGIIKGFCSFNKAQLQSFCEQYALAMSIDDLEFVRDYFSGEGRDPTETEIRVLDTYWSDHCRHTTFLTELTDIRFETNIKEIEQAYNEYKKLFKKHYNGRKDKYQCLMDMATIGVRELKNR